MENYNKYNESLDIDCGCNKSKVKKVKNDCDCGGISLPSHDNELEILVRQLQREVKELLDLTNKKLLCQDKKIAETMVYVKNNLANALRLLLNSMLESGELEELITGVVANAIEILESDVAKLKLDVSDINNQITQIKATITAIQKDIEILKDEKLEFEELEEQELNTNFLNVEVSTEYANDSIVYITKLKNINKLSCLPTNGNPTQDINTNKKNVIDYSKTNDDYDVYMNSGMNGINIFDTIINQTTRLDCPYYCGFTEDNKMKFYNGLVNTFSLDTLVNDNIVNCFSGFSPIIVNHQAFDFTDITDLANDNEIAANFRDSLPVKHPRQLIAQDDDNNFYIFSIMGRFNNSKGMNYYEMQNYFLDKNLKNVFNCDGGGSMQTVVNKEYTFYPSQELDTNENRLIPTIIGFKLKEV